MRIINRVKRDLRMERRGMTYFDFNHSYESSEIDHRGTYTFSYRKNLVKISLKGIDNENH